MGPLASSQGGPPWRRKSERPKLFELRRKVFTLARGSTKDHAIQKRRAYAAVTRRAVHSAPPSRQRFIEIAFEAGFGLAGDFARTSPDQP
jgi:hypothetical protein